MCDKLPDKILEPLRLLEFSIGGMQDAEAVRLRLSNYFTEMSKLAAEENTVKYRRKRTEAMRCELHGIKMAVLPVPTLQNQTEET